MTIEERVKKAIEEEVNPQLRSHGGAVKMKFIEDGVLYIDMLGECGGCPSQQFTIEDIVKPLIMAACPELVDVDIDNTLDEEFVKFAKEILGSDVFDD